MRELIERFGYRFQRWQRERYGDRWGADPTAPRNPLRFVAIVAIISVIQGVAGPFVFHRAFEVIIIIDISVALAFLALYLSKSRWAWHLVIAWVPLGAVLYWIWRVCGYARYQPRVHSPVWDLVGVLFQFAFVFAVVWWLVRIRQRYLDYIVYARSEET
jgi:hypothetical protein